MKKKKNERKENERKDNERKENEKREIERKEHDKKEKEIEKQIRDERKKHEKLQKVYSDGDINNVVWFGTSISKALNKSMFERDMHVNLKVVKAYGIQAEKNQRCPESNFTDIVPKVVENENPDAIILQTGSIEISNIDVKKALMDSDKNIEEYKNEWMSKVKEDSTNLFELSKRALRINPGM